MAHYKIQNNVPTPPRKAAGRPPSALRDLMIGMKVGQCVFAGATSKVEAVRQRSKFSSCATQIRKTDKNRMYTTRVMADGVRVWRVK